jgi:hypothetical protein
MLSSSPRDLSEDSKLDFPLQETIFLCGERRSGLFISSLMHRIVTRFSNKNEPRESTGLADFGADTEIRYVPGLISVTVFTDL